MLEVVCTQTWDTFVMLYKEINQTAICSLSWNKNSSGWNRSYGIFSIPCKKSHWIFMPPEKVKYSCQASKGKYILLLILVDCASFVDIILCIYKGYNFSDKQVGCVYIIPTQYYVLKRCGSLNFPFWDVVLAYFILIVRIANSIVHAFNSMVKIIRNKLRYLGTRLLPPETRTGDRDASPVPEMSPETSRCTGHLDLIL